MFRAINERIREARGPLRAHRDQCACVHLRVRRRDVRRADLPQSRPVRRRPRDSGAVRRHSGPRGDTARREGGLPQPRLPHRAQGRHRRRDRVRAGRFRRVNPYWLEEDAPPRRQVQHTGRVDVAIVGAGVTGCAAALRLAEGGLRVRVHDARAVAEGASGRNGGFALRGGATTVRRRTRDLRARACTRPVELDRACPRPDGRARRRRRYDGPAASASPSTRRSASRFAPSMRRSGRTGSTGVVRRSAGCARRPLRRRDPARGRRSAAAGALGAAACRRARPTRGWRSASTSSSATWSETLDAEQSDRRDGRLRSPGRSRSLRTRSGRREAR